MDTRMWTMWFVSGSSGDCPGNRNENSDSVKDREFLV
jgi:hypothetical protein